MLKYLYSKWIKIKKSLAFLKYKKKDMKWVIDKMGKSLLLLKAIK